LNPLQTQDIDLALKTRACRTLLDAWRSWRGARMIPHYADVDPGSIKSILSMIGIVDVRGKDAATFRLAGSGLRNIFGFDPTGRNAVALAPPEYRLRRAYRLFVPAMTPCGYLGESQFTYSYGITDWFESIGLPLQASEPGSNLVIFTLESLRGNQWHKKEGHLIENPENDFRFFDIGGGAVPPIDAPHDFLDG